jgi:MFS family permease
METMDSKWIKVGGTLMLGLFISFLDRANLSVVLPSLSQDLGYAGADFSTIVSSVVLTTFLWSYAFANIFGGVLGQRFDPKWVAIVTLAIWSIATMLTGLVTSVTMLIVLRLILGVTEGIYWPQQSRFARAWFAPDELSRANSLIQYYGQYLALATGFIVLSAIYNSFGWREVFYFTGGLGLVAVPIYMAVLKRESEAPYPLPKAGKGAKFSLKALGGAPFFLLVFVKFANSMLFWGITLWIPMAVKSIGFTGTTQALGSSLPYFAAIVLGVPMAVISDRTGKRIWIAALGLFLPGLLLITLPAVDSGYLKLAIITIALGFHASSFTPNFWSVVQSSVEPQAVGSAAGIVNGLGAGGGGTAAGFLIGLVQYFTGSYMYGFGSLGVMVILAGFALLLFEKIKSPARVAVFQN